MNKSIRIEKEIKDCSRNVFECVFQGNVIGVHENVLVGDSAFDHQEDEQARHEVECGVGRGEG
jgi:hypothetical protein